MTTQGNAGLIDVALQRLPRDMRGSGVRPGQEVQGSEVIDSIRRVHPTMIGQQ